MKKSTTKGASKRSSKAVKTAISKAVHKALSKDFFKSSFRVAKTVAKKSVRTDVSASTKVVTKKFVRTDVKSVARTSVRSVASASPNESLINPPKKTINQVLTINALQGELHIKIMATIRTFQENVPREELYDLIIHDVKDILIANHNSFCFLFKCEGDCGNVDTLLVFFTEVLRALLNKFFDYIINISVDHEVSWMAQMLLWHKVNIDVSNTIYDVFTKFLIKKSSCTHNHKN